MGGCYRSLSVESNSYAVDFKGGQSFGDRQHAAEHFTLHSMRIVVEVRALLKGTSIPLKRELRGAVGG